MIVQNDAQSLTKEIISKMNLQRIMQTLGGAAVWPKWPLLQPSILHILHPVGALYTWELVFLSSPNGAFFLRSRNAKAPLLKSDGRLIVQPVVH